MWVNMAINDIYYVGLGNANRNQRYMWVMNPAKEHCRTCLKLNGQIHRMKEYTQRGLVPQSRALECRGFNCGCALQKTDLPARGRMRAVPYLRPHQYKEIEDPYAITWKRTWDESQHPRDESGRFGAGGGGGGSSSNGNGGNGDKPKRDYRRVDTDHKFQKKWQSDLDAVGKENPRVLESTKYYTDEGYQKINGTLRGTSSELMEPKTIESIQDLDNLCNRNIFFY